MKKRKQSPPQKCYNIGKTRGLPFLVSYENFRKADEEIKSLGLTPVNPILQGIKPSRPYWMHIIANILLMAGCKYAYLQKNWEESKYAKIEYKAAQLLHLQIWYQDNPCCE